MLKAVLTLLFLLVWVVMVVASARSDETADRRVQELEGRLAQLENRFAHLPAPVVQHGSGGAIVFLYGCFCALWAQNTNRNPWLWFFLGLFFSSLAALILLAKHSNDRARLREKSVYEGFDV
jgi:hypothetical protein